MKGVGVLMSNLFSVDNAFFTFLGKVCDVLFLSVIWTVFCIPVVTIGPANTAIYYATVKVIRRERGYLFREFFKSFKLNFKRGFLVGLIMTVVFVVLSFDLYWGWNNLRGSSSMGSILFGIFVAITFVLICISMYIFPVLSRFDMTLKQLMKASAFMSMRHLPSTLAMVFITAVGFFSVYIFWILIFIMPAVVTLLNSLFMERILKKYMPKSEEVTDEDHPQKDEWYLE